MSEVARAKQRYLQNQFDARQQAVTNLEPYLGDFQLSEWSNRCFEALWGQPHFNWEEIRRRYREPDKLDIAIWQGDRLCGMALFTTTGQSVKLQFIEGDPDPDCPLVGRRILIALEVAANYAQARGKKEIILEPVNEALVNLYENTYGFEVVRPKNGPIFCRKQV